MEIVVPEIAENVKKAEILALLVSVGELVRAAQPVLELEADKASFEVPSPAAGKIERILVDIGDDVKVGDVVLMLSPFEERSSKRERDEPVAGAADVDVPIAASKPSVLASVSGPAVPYVRASPAARQRALELGVDLEALASELEGGRVTIEQIEARAGGLDDPDPELARAERTLDGHRFDGLINPLLRNRDEPMVHTWSSIPHLTRDDLIDVTALEAARCRYRDVHEAGLELSLTLFVLKACAMALREHPRMNSSLIRHGRALAVKRYVHIGVAIDTPHGRKIPVLPDADQRPLIELGEQLTELGEAARADTLTQEQLEGATFTLCRLGQFGRSHGTPVINPPQVGTLGLHRALTEGGRTLLPLSLSHDQRVIDGAGAKAFLTTVAELLHDPLAMLLRA